MATVRIGFANVPFPETPDHSVQDKVQLDPSEDTICVGGEGRHVFTAGPLTFGVTICHEGWRYPETVRYAVRRGAHLVFHPHFHPAEPGSYRPTTFADPANTFHEKAALCHYSPRAARAKLAAWRSHSLLTRPGSSTRRSRSSCRNSSRKTPAI